MSRVLKRPMFKMGGDVENVGIMDGMRKRYSEAGRVEDYDATYNRVKLVTSNRNYSFGIVGEQNFTANPNYVSFEGALLVDMDASDTAKLEWSQAGGLSIADIFDSTNLSIVLIC